MSKPFSMWVVYDHPHDLPYWWVARLWELDQPTDQRMLAADLEFLRYRLRAHGLVCLDRWPEDDPKIVETWI
jgi:hypothetical protein